MSNELQPRTQELNTNTTKEIGGSQWEQNLFLGSSVPGNTSSPPDLSYVPE